MECNQVEELLAPYVLGALESSEKDSVDSHVSACSHCSVIFAEYNETTSLLTYSVPLESPPSSVRDGLLQRLDQERGGKVVEMISWKREPGSPRGKVNWLASVHSAAAAIAIIVVGVLSISVWFNGRINNLASENEKLAERITVETSSLSNSIQLVANRNNQGIDRLTRQSIWLVDAVQAQRPLAQLTASSPGVNIYTLTNANAFSDARGMLMVSPSATDAILAVVQLQRLPLGKVYQVWLMKDGQRDNGGYFTVDSTGYGQMPISPRRPFHEYQEIGITIEPDGGSPGPTGEKVLGADM